MNFKESIDESLKDLKETVRETRKCSMKVAVEGLKGSEEAIVGSWEKGNSCAVRES
jgi:hypothetical protein